MKLKMSRGCIADWLGADGMLEEDMDDETRAKVYDKIIEFLKAQNDGVNQLMQFTADYSNNRKDICDLQIANPCINQQKVGRKLKK